MEFGLTDASTAHLQELIVCMKRVLVSVNKTDFFFPLTRNVSAVLNEYKTTNTGNMAALPAELCIPQRLAPRPSAAAAALH